MDHGFSAILSAAHDNLLRPPQADDVSISEHIRKRREFPPLIYEMVLSISERDGDLYEDRAGRRGYHECLYCDRGGLCLNRDGHD